MKHLFILFNTSRRYKDYLWSSSNKKNAMQLLKLLNGKANEAAFAPNQYYIVEEYDTSGKKNILLNTYIKLGKKINNYIDDNQIKNLD